MYLWWWEYWLGNTGGVRIDVSRILECMLPHPELVRHKKDLAVPAWTPDVQKRKEAHTYINLLTDGPSPCSYKPHIFFVCVRAVPGRDRCRNFENSWGKLKLKYYQVWRSSYQPPLSAARAHICRWATDAICSPFSWRLIGHYLPHCLKLHQRGMGAFKPLVCRKMSASFRPDLWWGPVIKGLSYCKIFVRHKWKY